MTYRFVYSVAALSIEVISSSCLPWRRRLSHVTLDLFFLGERTLPPEMYNFITQRIFVIRLFPYTISSALYLIFMDTHAPLGIAWRPFHHQRAFNAVNHILNSSPLLQYGLTSWDSINKMSTQDQSGNMYLVSALPHWLHSLLFSIVGNGAGVHLSQLFDYILICSVAALSAATFSRIFPSSSMSLSIF